MARESLHRRQLDGYYIFDLDRAGQITTGGRIRALSGVAHEALGRHFSYGVNESFLLPRGAMGRVDPDWSVDAHIGYAREIGGGRTLEVFTDLFGLPDLFKKEGVYAVDEAYTFDSADPIVGGDYEDLIWLKSRTTTGEETSNAVTRNRNFGNPSARYSTFFAQFGARLTF